MKKLVPQIENLSKISSRVKMMFENMQNLVPETSELEKIVPEDIANVDRIQEKLEERENQFLQKIELKIKEKHEIARKLKEDNQKALLASRNTASLPEIMLGPNQEPAKHSKILKESSSISSSLTTHSNQFQPPKSFYNPIKIYQAPNLSIINPPSKSHFQPHNSTLNLTKKHTTASNSPIRAHKEAPDSPLKQKDSLKTSHKETEKLYKDMSDEKEKLQQMMEKVQHMKYRRNQQ